MGCFSEEVGNFRWTREKGRNRGSGSKGRKCVCKGPETSKYCTYVCLGGMGRKMPEAGAVGDQGHCFNLVNGQPLTGLTRRKRGIKCEFGTT